jgi:hypothetical protein
MFGGTRDWVHRVWLARDRDDETPFTQCQRVNITQRNQDAIEPLSHHWRYLELMFIWDCLDSPISTFMQRRAVTSLRNAANPLTYPKSNPTMSNSRVSLNRTHTSQNSLQGVEIITSSRLNNQCMLV